MIEKELQDKLIKILQGYNMEYLHIPNRTFSNKMMVPKCLKYFPDLLFCHAGQTYIVEFSMMHGKKLRCLDRKKKQMERAARMEVDGGMIFRMITNHTELDAFMKEIELI
jgi:hypothetical protein